MSDYFLELGKATAAALAKSPETRERLAHFADQALTRHVGGRTMAHDALPDFAKKVRRNFGARDQEGLDPRGRDLPDVDLDTPVSAEECVSAIQQMLQVLSGPERAQLVGALHEILTTEPVDLADGTNAGALDRRPRSGSRGAEDRAFAARPGKSFSQRFPFTNHLDIWR